MSETNGLSQLKDFAPSSPLASDDAMMQADALRALTRGLGENKPVHRRVTDMLSVVLALSTRTRRMVMPPVSIDLDVFGPNGERALRLHMTSHD